MQFRSITFIATITLLSACGGGGGTQVAETPATSPVPAPPPTFTGRFLDSAVENLKFATESQSGSTNAEGQYQYQLSENVVFSIGDIELPAVEVKSLITPLDVFGTREINDTSVVNLLRLLQSLDEDGDATNGIKIPEMAHEMAAGLSVNFAADDFDSQVNELIANSGVVFMELISADEAVYHFQQTLDSLDQDGISTCPQTHPMVGYTGTFQTKSHNVAGTATIIDDCTIHVTNFDYDGGGPAVYFYAATDFQFDGADAFAVSNDISGPEYENYEFVLTLPSNKTLDDLNTLSVWCVQVGVDFGSLEFTP